MANIARRGLTAFAASCTARVSGRSVTPVSTDDTAASEHGADAETAQPSGPPPPPHRRRWVLPSEAYTPWVKRLLAFLIDWTPIWILIAAPYVIEGIESGAGCAVDIYVYNTCQVSALSATATLMYLVLIAVWFFWNFCYRQGKTGQSIGKSVLKFKVISEQTWQPIGFWRSFLRQLAHYVDQLICNLGYLWPLWDDKRQTFADKIMSTICIPVNTEPTQVMTPRSIPMYEAPPPYRPPKAAPKQPSGKSTKVRCHHCQHVQTVPLSQQTFVCEECGTNLKRRTPVEGS